MFPAIGVELADAGIRLVVLSGAQPIAHRLVERRKRPLELAEAPAALVELALRSLRQDTALQASLGMGAPARASLGVALEGRVQRATGTVIQAAGLPEWTNAPLAALLKDRFELVTVESAVNAAALAEAVYGAGRDSASMLYASLGRRVNAAFVVDGHILRGAHDRAGQLGHWRVADQGPRCACGTAGHLDPLASAQAIVRNMIGLASDSEASHDAMLRVSNGRAEAISAAQVFTLAAQGDPAATSVVTAASEALSAALANLLAMLDPEVIVLDAPFAGHTEDFVLGIRERVHALTAAYASPPRVVASQLGASATVLGARLIAIRAAQGSHRDT